MRPSPKEKIIAEPGSLKKLNFRGIGEKDFLPGSFFLSPTLVTAHSFYSVFVLLKFPAVEHVQRRYDFYRS
jgi:hypothetical protein